MPGNNMRKHQAESDEEGGDDNADDFSLLFKTISDRLLKKRKEKAEAIVGRAKGKKEDVMSRYTEMVNTSHPAQLNKIHLELLESLSAQDATLSQLWEEVNMIHVEAQDAMTKYLAETDRLSDEVKNTRESFSARLAKHLDDERKAVEMLMLALPGVGSRSIRKKPRRTDATLVDSD